VPTALRRLKKTDYKTFSNKIAARWKISTSDVPIYIEGCAFAAPEENEKTNKLGSPRLATPTGTTIKTASYEPPNTPKLWQLPR
jgi:hypothetical protein